MSSFLFCTSYINSEFPNLHPLRYRKWIEYYSEIKKDLGAEYIFIIDDGTPELAFVDRELVDIIYIDQNLPERLSKKINILSFRSHLGRSSLKEYPGWWRSFTYSVRIADKYRFEKIIHIESDFYIVSKRLCDFLEKLKEGWTTLYSSFYKFPETAIQVICRDCFPLLRELCTKGESRNYRFDDFAEKCLPFTTVVKEFNGDRIMEPPVLRNWSSRLDFSELDYIGQLPTNIRPFSNSEFSGFMKQLKAEMSSNRNMTFGSVMDILRGRNAVLEY